jgi:hypothetical protein
MESEMGDARKWNKIEEKTMFVRSNEANSNHEIRMRERQAD